MEINTDGSVKDQTFSGSKYTGEYPHPKMGETFAEYRSRVNKCREEGFHLGDLSWSDYTLYCMGSGQYEGVDSNNQIQN